MWVFRNVQFRTSSWPLVSLVDGVQNTTYKISRYQLVMPTRKLKLWPRNWSNSSSKWLREWRRSLAMLKAASIRFHKSVRSCKISSKYFTSVYKYSPFIWHCLVIARSLLIDFSCTRLMGPSVKCVWIVSAPTFMCHGIPFLEGAVVEKALSISDTDGIVNVSRLLVKVGMVRVQV